MGRIVIIFAAVFCGIAVSHGRTITIEYVTVDDLGHMRGTNVLTSPEFNARISHTNPSFSNEVLAVQLDTNVVAQIGELKQFFDDIPTGTVGISLGGLLSVLLSAAAWLKRNKADKENLFAKYAQENAYSVGNLVLKDGTVYKCKTAVAAGSAWDATKWETSGIDANAFATDFLGKHVAINALHYALYSVPTTGADANKLKDRAVNAFTFSGGSLPTFPAQVAGYARDFLLNVTATADGSNITIPEPDGSTATSIGDALAFTAGKTYLVAITEIAAKHYYIRVIDTTPANAA